MRVDTGHFEPEGEELQLLIECMRGHVRAAIFTLECVIAAFDQGPQRDPGETIYASFSVPLVDVTLIARACPRQRADRLCAPTPRRRRGWPTPERPSF